MGISAHLSLALLVATVLVAVNAKVIPLPPNFVKEHVCKRNDPEIERCLLKGVEDLRPYLKGGVPQFNIPSIDPFLMPEIAIELGGINVKSTNLVAHGGSAFKITNLKVSEDRMTIKSEIEIPEIHYEYDYNIDLEFASLPIKGFGTVRGNISDIKADVKMIGQLEDRKDGQHIIFKKFDVNVDVGETYVKFTNDYKGATLLTEATNVLINANSRQLNTLFKPLTNHIVSSELPAIFRKVTESFVFEDIFPAN